MTTGTAFVAAVAPASDAKRTLPLTWLIWTGTPPEPKRALA
jgi:hypothetical protein